MRKKPNADMQEQSRPTRVNYIVDLCVEKHSVTLGEPHTLYRIVADGREVYYGTDKDVIERFKQYIVNRTPWAEIYELEQRFNAKHQ